MFVEVFQVHCLRKTSSAIMLTITEQTSLLLFLPTIKFLVLELEENL